jgi:hypothetical protein
MSKMFTFKTAGGRITCIQCSAKSKRTQQQCRAPAARGKSKCRFHGAASKGPITEQGRKRCADAKTVHGKETRRKREETRAALVKIALLEEMGRSIGLIVGPRSRGRKPSGYKFNSSS